MISSGGEQFVRKKTSEKGQFGGTRRASSMVQKDYKDNIKSNSACVPHHLELLE